MITSLYPVAGVLTRALTALLFSAVLSPRILSQSSTPGPMIDPFGDPWGNAIEGIPNPLTTGAVSLDKELQEAFVLYRNKRFAEAIDLARQAVGRNPSLALGYRLIAASSLELGDFEQARLSLREALTRNPGDGAVLLDLARTEMLADKPEAAVELLKEALVRKPRDWRSRLLLADLHQKQGRLAEAASELETAFRELPPEEASSLRGTLARLYNRTGQFEKTVELYERAGASREMAPSDLEPFATALLAIGKTGEAIASFEAAFETAPSAALAMGLGIAYRAANRLHDSQARLEEAIAMNDRWSPARQQLAETLVLLKDYDGAIASLRSAMELDAADPRLPLRTADVLLMANRPGEAIDLLSSLPHERGAELEVLLRKAQAELAVGRHEDAESTARAATRGHPGSSDAWLIHARILAIKGDREGLLLALEKAATLSPHDVAVQRAFTDALVAADRTEEALEHATKVSGRLPSLAEPRLYLAQLHSKSGNDAKAAEIYQDVLRSFPDHVVALNNLAMIKARGNELAEARRLAEKAVSLLPESGQLLGTLGWIYLSANDVERAMATLEDAVKRSPADASLHYHLGLAYSKSGRVPDALAALRTALAHDGDFPEHGEARRLLASLSQ